MIQLPGNWYGDSAHSTPPRPPLEGDIATDVCIVGGGMTGCSAALHLAERGYSVRLIEAQHIGHGASGRSGGQLIAGYGAEISSLGRSVDTTCRQSLWDLGMEAVDLTRALIDKHAIACDFAPGHIHVGFKPRHMVGLREMMEEWESFGHGDLDWIDAGSIREVVQSDAYLGGLRDRRAGHLHPLNYTLGLARAAEAAGAHLHEGTAYRTHEDTGGAVRVVTDRSTIRAKWLILAGNAYIWGKAKGLRATIMPVGTYVIATEPLGQQRAEALIPGNEAIADIAFVLNYYRRSADHRLLFGGGVSYTRLDPMSIKASLRKVMLRYFPQLADVTVTHGWGGNVAITINRMPHFGRLGSRTLFAHGYSGHGVAMTGLAGRLMAEVIGGTEERFDIIARLPHLPFPGGSVLRTPLLVLGTTWARLRDLL
ncbi:MAG: FAD-binding oxidoreductase [Rhodospirillum sp.]|nr:FAD-binding oxidoreductase [Rhodospirillum sp.]MCF8490822.1 FAD-binding oxidoreductase [Rhodospirillum sp.]MCF8501703.1 FAD-binding oxidoreductase [Rhodospirillum sp.]